jgi:hypothetical protein
MQLPIQIEGLFSNTGYLGEFFYNLIQFALIFFIFAGIFGIGFNIFKLVTKSEKVAECISSVVLNLILIIAVIFIQDLLVVDDSQSIINSINYLISG